MQFLGHRVPDRAGKVAALALARSGPPYSQPTVLDSFSGCAVPFTERLTRARNMRPVAIPQLDVFVTW